MDLNEKTLTKDLIYHGEIFDVWTHEVSLPNGEKSKRDVVLHNGAVSVLAITPEKEVILVEQFRKALEHKLLEIPAGKLEKNEKRIDAAKRELEEETGYISKDLKMIGEVYGSPGFCNEKISIYVADELTEGKVNLDDDEFLNLIRVPIKDIKSLIENGKINDAKTMIALQYVLLNYNHYN